MIKEVPPLSRILAMVVFGVSCFCIVLFLWITFGGQIPLKAKGYRFQADFTEASLLVADADVRISGVNVGRVIVTERVGEIARSTIEIDSRYAPIPRDTRVTQRQKTVGGETYIELTPGSPRAGMLPENGRLPVSQARETSEIDEILRSVFDPKTRRATQRFLAELAVASKGRGEDVNDALGHFGTFAEESGTLLRILDQEREAVRRLIRDGGFVLSAVGRRQGELSGLIRASDRVLTTTARRNRDLEETVRILPTTLRELRPTFRELEGFSLEAQPVVRALRPAGRELGPALVHLSGLAPDVRGLFRDVDDVISAARRGLPATTRTVNAARPVVQQLASALRDLLPVVDFIGMYKSETVALLANSAAGFQFSDAGSDGVRRHYFRAIIPFSIEGIVGAEQRVGSNRHNPYLNPRALDKLATGLEAIDCGNVNNPAVDPAPPCKVEAPLEFRGRRSQFPQIKRDP